MNDIIFGLAYLTAIAFAIFIPFMVLDWLFDLLYRYNRRFHKLVNRFFRSLPQWKGGR